MIIKIGLITAISGLNLGAVPVIVNESINQLNDESQISNYEFKRQAYERAFNEYNVLLSDGIDISTPSSYGITPQMGEKLRAIAATNKTWDWIGSPIFESIPITIEGDEDQVPHEMKSTYLYPIKLLLEKFYSGLSIEMKSVKFSDAPETYANKYNEAVNLGSAHANSKMGTYASNFTMNVNNYCKDLEIDFQGTNLYPDQQNVDFWPINPNEWTKELDGENVFKSGAAQDKFVRDCQSYISKNSTASGNHFTNYNIYGDNIDKMFGDWELNSDYFISKSVDTVEPTLMRYTYSAITDAEYKATSQTVMTLSYFDYGIKLSEELVNTSINNQARIIQYNNINDMASDFMAMNDFLGWRDNNPAGAINHRDMLDINNLTDPNPILVIPAGFESKFASLIDANIEDNENYFLTAGEKANNIRVTAASGLHYNGGSYSTIIGRLAERSLPYMVTQKVSSENILNEIFNAIFSTESVVRAQEWLMLELSNLLEEVGLREGHEEEKQLILDLYQKGLLKMIVSYDDLYWNDSDFYKNQLTAMSENISKVFEAYGVAEQVEMNIELLDNTKYNLHSMGITRDYSFSGVTNGIDLPTTRALTITATDYATVIFNRAESGKYTNINSIGNHDTAVSLSPGLLEKVIEAKGIWKEYFEYRLHNHLDVNSLVAWGEEYGIHIYQTSTQVLSAVDRGDVSLGFVNNSTTYGGSSYANYINILKLGAFDSAHYTMNVSRGLSDDRGAAINRGFYEFCQNPIDGSNLQSDDEQIPSFEKQLMNVTCGDLRKWNPDFTKPIAEAAIITERESIILFNFFSKTMTASNTGFRLREASTFSGRYELMIAESLLSRYRLLGIAFILAILAMITWNPIFKSVANSQKNIELANIDDLTGLYNKRYLDARREYYVTTSKESLTVCYLDFDKFKMVNDFYGHNAGDMLLKIVSKKMSLHGENKFDIFRVGGDEFVIVAQDISKNKIEELMVKLRSDISRKLLFASYQLKPIVSIGICQQNMNPRPNITEMVKAADFALYEAKRGNGVAWYLQKESKIFAFTNNLIKEGITTETLEPNFQPIVNAKGKVLGFESLFRTNSLDVNKNIGKLISQLEKNNSTHIIDYAMVNKVTEIITTKWKDAFLKSDIWISVNISPQTMLKQLFFIEEAAKVLKDNGIPLSRFVIEILEFDSEDNELLCHIERIKELGFSTAIDDFTAGSSSMSRIVALENKIDHIKINQDVIQKSKAKIVEKTVEFTWVLADAINCESVVVEGVETKDKIIGKKGTLYQGFYFSKPKNQDDAFKILKKGHISKSGAK